MDELEVDEGRRSRLYLDSLGIPTVGVGRNLRDLGLSDSEIDLLLRNDIDRVCKELNRYLPWWSMMSDDRQRVLANMCFNMGIEKLLGFRNTLRAMEIGDYGEAADGMLASLWARQVGPRAIRLADRMRGTPREDA